MDLKTDGTLKTDQLSFSTLDCTFPAECLGTEAPTVCTEVGELLVDALEQTEATGSAVCASSAGVCTCQLEERLEAEFPGVWSIEGTQLTVTYDLPDHFIGTTGQTVDYCVEDSFLSIRTLGPPGQETVQIFRR